MSREEAIYGKTYFSLSDNLNFNGKAIKIKANSTETPTKEENKGRAYFNADYQTQIYQSILASQPQVGLPKNDSHIQTETDNRFLNSFAQVGSIDNLILEGVDPADITWIVFVNDYVYAPDKYNSTMDEIK